MRPIRYIRTSLLKLDQAGFGKIAGVDQSTVARWESGETYPNLRALRRIRSAAMRSGVAWNDSLFFTTRVRGQASDEAAA